MMSKHMTAMILLLGLTAQTAHATPLGEFDGDITFSTVSAGCAGNPRVGRGDYLMRYFPPGIGSNGQATRITLRKWAPQGDIQDYYLESGTLVGTTLVPVVVTQIGSTVGVGTARAKITQVPAMLANTTNSVKVTVGIASYRGIAGCNVTFGATLFSY